MKTHRSWITIIYHILIERVTTLFEEASVRVPCIFPAHLLRAWGMFEWLDSSLPPGRVCHRGQHRSSVTLRRWQNGLRLLQGSASRERTAMTTAAVWGVLWFLPSRFCLCLLWEDVAHLLQQKLWGEVSELVSWYFEPSQPQRITSGLKTMFNLSAIYSACKSSYHKLSKTHQISPDTCLQKTKEIIRNHTGCITSSVKLVSSWILTSCQPHWVISG